MKASTIRTLLVAVGAVELLAGGAAIGQYQIDNSRANDASNRIGSGGYNRGGIPAPETTYNANQVVTGNVTGGQSFRGPVPYRAVGEFAGPSATANFDRQIRDSSSPQVSYNQRNTNFANTPQPFYTTMSAPPEGFVRTAPGSGGFVASGTQSFGNTRYDERLGVLTNSAPGDTILPRPGQLVMPGPVDASANQTFIAASPLTGVRQFNVGDPSAAALLGQNSNLNTTIRSGLSDEQILRLRRELSPTLNTPDLQPDPATGGPQSAVPGQVRPLNAQAPVAFDAPENRSVSPQPLGGAIASTANNIATGQASRDRLPSPSEQSSQYAELRRRLERYDPTAGQPKTDEEANREARAQAAQRQQQQDQQAGARSARTGTGATSGKEQAQAPNKLDVPQLGSRAQETATGGTGRGKTTDDRRAFVQTPSGGVTAYVPTAPDAKPVEVKSLATGVKAPGLKSLLEQAESNMRDGKFDTAITVYESSAQVAPNNPMILLGQANAELGGEYFARAENHLRQAFLLDPALLMARYDLRAMLGDKRLDQVIESLKRIAAAEQRQSRPAFLLAYVAYNAGDTERASSYLELAERRAGGADPVFRLLRSHWNLPASPGATTTPAGGANK